MAWIYIGAKREVESVLDTRLQEAARMVPHSYPAVPWRRGNCIPVTFPKFQATNANCPARSGHWTVGWWRAPAAHPNSKLGDIRAGFSERLIDGETWRVYTIEDVAKGVRVLVGDRLGLREHLVAELIEGLLAPTLLIIPLLGFLIWASLDRGLKPLQAIARELSLRSADDMSPMETGRVPTEVHPVIASLNALFAKVQAARRHEREFIAFAAHELRTPLAGLRTQAQISIAATERPVREIRATANPGRGKSIHSTGSAITGTR